MGKAARLKRERQQARAAAPPSRGRQGLIVILALALLGLVGVAVAAAMILPGGGERSSAGGPVSGLQKGRAPWFPDEQDLPARLEASGVPYSNMEGTAMHIHPRLVVVANGKRVVVPTGIGISERAQTMAALHTHDELGTIHVESPIVREYTLGQFFDTWGVRLTKKCVGGYCSDGGKRLRVLVDGKAVSGNPREVTLADDERILLAFGTPAKISKATR
jgi:hypothetical protein